jgi:hypothetical protein
MVGEMAFQVGELTCPVGELTCPVGEYTCLLGELTCPVSEMTCPVSEMTCPVGELTSPIGELTLVYTSGGNFALICATNSGAVHPATSLPYSSNTGSPPTSSPNASGGLRIRSETTNACIMIKVGKRGEREFSRKTGMGPDLGPGLGLGLGLDTHQ